MEPSVRHAIVLLYLCKMYTVVYICTVFISVLFVFFVRTSSRHHHQPSSAPEVLVIPTSEQEVSANVTIETTTRADASCRTTFTAMGGGPRLGAWTAGQTVPHDALLGESLMTFDLHPNVIKRL